MPSDILLMFLMFTNMIAGVLLLPAYIARARSNFIRQYRISEERVSRQTEPRAHVVAWFTKAVNMSRDAMVLG